VQFFQEQRQQRFKIRPVLLVRIARQKRTIRAKKFVHHIKLECPYGAIQILRKIRMKKMGTHLQCYQMAGPMELVPILRMSDLEY
jgi:hypothetical protein